MKRARSLWIAAVFSGLFVFPLPSAASGPGSYGLGTMAPVRLFKVFRISGAFSRRLSKAQRVPVPPSSRILDYFLFSA